MESVHAASGGVPEGRIVELVNRTTVGPEG